MRKQCVAVTILLMITASVLLAHDLFLKLDSYFVPPNTLVRVAVLNGSFSSSEGAVAPDRLLRSEEHTSELQSRENLVCRLLLEKKKKKKYHQLNVRKKKNTKKKKKIKKIK